MNRSLRLAILLSALFFCAAAVLAFEATAERRSAESYLEEPVDLVWTRSAGMDFDLGVLQAGPGNLYRTRPG
ncbi:MAG TPA: hypothetical protein VG796_08510 [Verrucomicrobiales bacterium]|jgi:hypothetical protein|nr:hypothetical protein [Verrucomicrobiales bacterium]